MLLLNILILLNCFINMYVHLYKKYKFSIPVTFYRDYTPDYTSLKLHTYDGTPSIFGAHKYLDRTSHEV